MNKWPIDRQYGLGLDDIAPLQGPKTVKLPDYKENWMEYIRAWHKKNPARSRLHEAKWRQLHPKRWAELNAPYASKYQAKRAREKGSD